MAGQVRNDELLVKAVTTDGRNERHCRLCSETMDKVEVPQVQDGHSVCVSRQTHASSVVNEWTQLVCIVFVGSW